MDGLFWEPLASAASNNPKVSFVLFLLVVAVIIWTIVYMKRTTSELATPDNIQRIASEQVIKILQSILLKPSKKGIDSIVMPEPQKLLINTSVQATRLVGYIGPYLSGVFHEDTAVQKALGSGARCLVLEVGRDTDGEEPKLIYRDGWGVKQSLNTGSLQKVAKSIAGRAFQVANEGVPGPMESDPLILVVYFSSTPDPSASPQEYIRFLGRVAEQLQPLKPYLLDQTPQGDFRRQAMEDKIFFMPYSTFSKKIILLTNVDTTMFRRLESLGLKGEMGPTQDLDLMTHCRLYSRESPSGLGMTSQPSSSISPSAVITTPQYWLNIPPDRLADAQTQTKKAWSLVMNPIASESNAVSTENLKKLLIQYGVHAVPFTIFDNANILQTFVGMEAPYEKIGWVAKPELLRFIPPTPITLLKPSPQTNANGGAIFSPSL
jgi:hypothetical protein